jgi:hypothetical protein
MLIGRPKTVTWFALRKLRPHVAGRPGHQPLTRDNLGTNGWNAKYGKDIDHAAPTRAQTGG